jgi:hypothetical protein
MNVSYALSVICLEDLKSGDTGNATTFVVLKKSNGRRAKL